MYHDYVNNYLKLAMCNTFLCTMGLFAYPDWSGAGGVEDISFTIGADGFGLISYYDSTNGDIIIARCLDDYCSQPAKYQVSSPNIQGIYSSVTIGMDGLGLVSFYDATSQSLYVLHCANTFCQPYFHRR